MSRAMRALNEAAAWERWVRGANPRLRGAERVRESIRAAHRAGYAAAHERVTYDGHGAPIVEEVDPTSTVHACPLGDEDATPCCNKSPWALPRTDRITVNPEAVTCTPTIEERFLQ